MNNEAVLSRTRSRSLLSSPLALPVSRATLSYPPPPPPAPLPDAPAPRFGADAPEAVNVTKRNDAVPLASTARDLQNYTVFARVSEAEGNINRWCERDGRISIFGRANK